MLSFFIRLFKFSKIKKKCCVKTTLCKKCGKIIYVGEKCFVEKTKDNLNHKIKRIYCAECVKNRKGVLKEIE